MSRVDADSTGCSLFLWEDEDEGRNDGMEKMRPSSLDTGAAWCGGGVNLGTSNPHVDLSKLLLSSREWLFLCEDQRIRPISDLKHLPAVSGSPGKTGKLCHGFRF